jgi:predicted dehydrogenase
MIRIGVIGAGRWGPNLIRNFHTRQESVVISVVDRDRGRIAQVQSRFADVQVGDDPAMLIADPTIDAVVVATPTSTHYGLVKAALEQKKHVLVEKPITADARQAEELRALADRFGRVLMVGHVFLYNAGVQRVKQILDAGDLGRIYYMSMVRTNLGPIRMDVNAAWDLASHDLSIVNYWLDAAPTSVSAVGGSWINPGVEDAVFATLRYPNGVLVNLHASWLNPRKNRDVTVVGDRRMLTFDDMNLNEPLRIYDKQVTDERTHPAYVDSFASFRSSVRDGDITIPRVAMNEPLKAECDHVLECIATGRRPRSDGTEGLAVVRALEALACSVRNAGREEQV